jgi:hypothetical protein
VKCPACGFDMTMPFFAGWNVGDRVRHLTRLGGKPQNATVIEIDPVKGVHVQFEGDPRGVLNTDGWFDAGWDRIVRHRHPGGLLVKL